MSGNEQRHPHGRWEYGQWVPGYWSGNTFIRSNHNNVSPMTPQQQPQQQQHFQGPTPQQTYPQPSGQHYNRSAFPPKPAPGHSNPFGAYRPQDRYREAPQPPQPLLPGQQRRPSPVRRALTDGNSGWTEQQMEAARAQRHREELQQARDRTAARGRVQSASPDPHSQASVPPPPPKPAFKMFGPPGPQK